MKKSVKFLIKYFLFYFVVFILIWLYFQYRYYRLKKYTTEMSSGPIIVLNGEYTCLDLDEFKNKNYIYKNIIFTNYEITVDYAMWDKENNLYLKERYLGENILILYKNNFDDFKFYYILEKNIEEIGYAILYPYKNMKSFLCDGYFIDINSKSVIYRDYYFNPLDYNSRNDIYVTYNRVDKCWVIDSKGTKLFRFKFSEY